MEDFSTLPSDFDFDKVNQIMMNEAFQSSNFSSSSSSGDLMDSQPFPNHQQEPLQEEPIQQETINNNTNQQQQETTSQKYFESQLDILLAYEDQCGNEYFQDIPCLVTPDQSAIMLKSVLNYLESNIIPCANFKFFYYSPSREAYIYCGSPVAIEQNHEIPLTEIEVREGRLCLGLKIRRPVEYFKQLETENPFTSSNYFSNANQNLNNNNNNFSSSTSKSDSDHSSSDTMLVNIQYVQQQQQQKQKQPHSDCDMLEESSSFISSTHQGSNSSCISNFNNNCVIPTPLRSARVPSQNSKKQSQEQTVIGLGEDDDQILPSPGSFSQSMNILDFKSKTRTKHAERTIRQVVTMVNKWRSLNQGFFDPEKNTVVRYSLSDAAKMVGVPRKSLDDYLLMMKHAKAFGFKFSEHMNEKFGVIRTFVKKAKASQKDDENNNNNSNLMLQHQTSQDQLTILNEEEEGENSAFCEDIDQGTKIAMALSKTSKKIAKGSSCHR